MTRRYRGVDTEPGWINRRFKDLQAQIDRLSSAKRLEASSVAGGVTTIREILRDPTGPIQFENTDTGTCPADGADVPIVLTHVPKGGSEQVFYAGWPLKRADWTRTGTLLTIPGQPWFRAGRAAWVDYAYDGTAAPVGPAIASPTAGESTLDTTPTISGTGAPGYSVHVSVDGTSVGTTTVDTAGSWALTPAALSVAVHTVTATQESPDGSTLDATPVTFTVGTPAPLTSFTLRGSRGAAANAPLPLPDGTQLGDTILLIVMNQRGWEATVTDSRLSLVDARPGVAWNTAVNSAEVWIGIASDLSDVQVSAGSTWPNVIAITFAEHMSVASRAATMGDTTGVLTLPTVSAGSALLVLTQNNNTVLGPPPATSAAGYTGLLWAAGPGYEMWSVYSYIGSPPSPSGSTEIINGDAGNGTWALAIGVVGT